MPRFSLRMLIIVMLLGGPVIWWGWWEWKARIARERAIEVIEMLNRHDSWIGDYSETLHGKD